MRPDAGGAVAGVGVADQREMIVGGSLALQEAVSVSVAEGTWDLARMET